MKAGFAAADITPRLGVQLAGYGPYRNRAARKITAPLRARAMALSEGKRRAVLLCLELVGADRGLSQRIRSAVAARVGCAADEVFLTATHTHSSPAIGGTFGWGEADAMYVETLPSRAAAAAEDAWARRREVEWRYAESPCEGIAMNRETDKGGWMVDPIAVRLAPEFRPARPQDTDPTVRVLAAYADGKLHGLLHHFGCHPVVGSEQTFDVHGDFVGLASARLEKIHAGATAIFLPGALGDINPPVCHRGPAETKLALRVLTQKYTTAVKAGLRAATPLNVAGLKSLRQDAPFARKRWKKKAVEQRIAEFEKIFAAAGITDDTRVGEPPLHTHGLTLARLQGLRAILADYAGQEPPRKPVNVQGLRIGPVALLGCGLEIFHALQAPILRGSPHPHTWVVSLTGGIGYAPDEPASKRSGYTDEFVPVMVGELPFQRVHDELPVALVKLARELV